MIHRLEPDRNVGHEADNQGRAARLTRPAPYWHYLQGEHLCKSFL